MKPAQFLNHLILLAGAAFLILPIAVIFFSSTHATSTLLTEGMQLSWGGHFIENYTRVLSLEAGYTDDITALGMMKNSLIVGGGVAVLTTVFSLLTAYAIVFFRFRIANLVFWLVFVTLLFPLESRFLPTFSVTTELGLINTQLGIILPVLALALGTFFFRQHFLTIPNEYLDAAVFPGDVIVGDSDGVIVLPAQLADEIAEECSGMEDFETFVLESVQAGHSVIGLYPPTRPETDERYAAWLQARTS